MSESLMGMNILVYYVTKITDKEYFLDNTNEQLNNLPNLISGSDFQEGNWTSIPSYLNLSEIYVTHKCIFSTSVFDMSTKDANMSQSLNDTTLLDSAKIVHDLILSQLETNLTA